MTTRQCGFISKSKGRYACSLWGVEYRIQNTQKFKLGIAQKFGEDVATRQRHSDRAHTHTYTHTYACTKSAFFREVEMSRV